MINSPRLMAFMLVLLVVLSGCSMFGNNEPEYLESVEVEPLTIPEGLDDPRGETQVVISVPLLRMPAGDELEPKPPTCGFIVNKLLKRTNDFIENLF